MILLFILLSIIALCIILFLYCACKVASMCDEQIKKDDGGNY